MSQLFSTAEELEKAFYTAFRSVDAEYMAGIWLPEEHVYCIHPNGPLFLGYDEVMESWISIFSGAADTALVYDLLQTKGNSTVRVHIVEEHVGSGMNAVSVLATNTYQDTGKGWKMTGHHASMKSGKRLEVATGTLH